MNKKIIDYYKWLSLQNIELFDKYKIVNPYKQERIIKIVEAFYNKYFDDNNNRYLILGASPARRGTSATGIPFEDEEHIYKLTGESINNFYINKNSSNFLYDVMENYGGIDKFYSDFFLGFVCPLGIVNINNKNNEVNVNYYENRKLQSYLNDFIKKSLDELINIGINREVCYCIGSGKNFQFLLKLNEENYYFKRIVALEHPRYIMQYNKDKTAFYMNKYLNELNNKL